MKNEWKSPKIIIGKDATGEYYYRREETENEIWYELQKGNNVLIAAPRRVGKTSVMKYITENPKDGYKLIFRNVQGIDTEQVFYKTIYELIICCLDKFKSKVKWWENYINSKKITEISFSGGIKIEDKDINYLQEINEIIPKLEASEEAVVLLLDELPEVLHNIYKKGNKDIALSIIKNLRHWRQENKYKKLQWVLAGSIGLHYVINLIEGRSSDINDLKKVYYQPLGTDEKETYLDWATENATVKYNKTLRKYLFNKIQYYVPYFINLMLDEIDKDAHKKNQTIVTQQGIDYAFDRIIKHNEYFSDWKKRLEDYLPTEDFNFVNEVLIHIAHKDQITIQEIYNKAVNHNKTTSYMDLIYDLEHDGYVVEHNKKYIFISPFLKEFWNRNNPVYNG